MKALEFVTYVNPDQTLQVPPELAEQLPALGMVRVLVLVADAVDEKDWREAAEEAFLAGYAETDASYDPLAGK
jgi:hypothetical protein